MPDLYVESDAVVGAEQKSLRVFGTFILLFGVGLLIPYLWALATGPRGDLLGVFVAVMLGFMVFVLLLTGTTYLLISKLAEGVRVTTEGIFITPRPVDVLLRRARRPIRFEEVDRLYEGPQTIPSPLARIVGERTWVLTDSGWKEMEQGDILICPRNRRPHLVRSGEVSDRRRFLEAVSTGARTGNA